MSIYNGLFLQQSPTGNKISPHILYSGGPLISVAITIPNALVQLYQKEQRPIPAPISGIALIDTGATKTCVHDKIMEKLGVQTTGVTTTHTANGPKQSNLYPAHFSFPAPKIEIDFNSVLEVDLSGQTFQNQQIVALIGRDLLSRAVLVYNGPAGMFTIAI